MSYLNLVPSWFDDLNILAKSNNTCATVDADVDADANDESIYLKNKFEEISKNTLACDQNMTRHCRCMKVPIDAITLECGQYCLLMTEGGGMYTQWYYYKTLDCRHMLIFESTFNFTKTYSCREISSTPTEQNQYLEQNHYLEFSGFI